MIWTAAGSTTGVIAWCNMARNASATAEEPNLTGPQPDGVLFGKHPQFPDDFCAAHPENIYVDVIGGESVQCQSRSERFKPLPEQRMVSAADEYETTTSPFLQSPCRNLSDPALS